MMDLLGLNRRLESLERSGDVAAASVAVDRAYDFLVAPSCPPDKRLHIRGGYATESYGFDGTMLQSDTPSVTCDFQDFTDTQMELVFNGAGYYLPIILCYHGAWISRRSYAESYEHPVFDNVAGTEVATAAEAEAQIDAWMNGYTDWSYYRFPLRGVVLRNDGDVGSPYAILPIDLVNRGRSYLYRDARSWTSLGSS